MIEGVLTDPNLNAQTVKLWQLVFTRARFNSNLEVRLSYQELAQLLHRSIRSIVRYTKTLCHYGYLELNHNYNLDGGQGFNTFCIRIPMTTIHQARQTKDRALGSSFSQTQQTYVKDKESHPIDKVVMAPHDKNGIANININKDNNNNNVVVGFFPQNNFSERQNVIHEVEQQINSLLDQLPKLQRNRDVAQAAWIQCNEISNGVNINKILAKNRANSSRRVR